MTKCNKLRRVRKGNKGWKRVRSNEILGGSKKFLMEIDRGWQVTDSDKWPVMKRDRFHVTKSKCQVEVTKCSKWRRATMPLSKKGEKGWQRVKKGDKQPKEGDNRRRGCVTGDRNSCPEIAGNMLFSKFNWCWVMNPVLAIQDLSNADEIMTIQAVWPCWWWLNSSHSWRLWCNMVQNYTDSTKCLKSANSTNIRHWICVQNNKTVQIVLAQ